MKRLCAKNNQMYLRLYIHSFLGGLVILITSGCGVSTPRPEHMTATRLGLSRSHPYSVNVQIDESIEFEQKHPEGAPFKSGELRGQEVFLMAIRDSIRQSRIFSKGLMEEDADYFLHVTLAEVSLYLEGPKTTYTLLAEWKLTHALTDKVVYQEWISKSCTLGISDALLGATRDTATWECAVRKSIKEGLQALSKLEL